MAVANECLILINYSTTQEQNRTKEQEKFPQVPNYYTWVIYQRHNTAGVRMLHTLTFVLAVNAMKAF